MSYTDEQRRLIGEEVTRIRVLKGLGKEGASEAAGVSSITWKRVEDGEPVRDASLGRVLVSLELEVQQILHGRQRSPSQPAAANVDPPAEHTVADERKILEQSWSRVTRLADAVLDTDDASEELRAAARDVVYDVSAHLIIRILTGEFSRQLEGWLARIYSEREGLYRQLSTGEPEFPWFTGRNDMAAQPLRGDVSAADLVGQIRELFGELRRRVPQVGAVVDESQVWSQSFVEGLRDELPTVGRREDRDHTDELGGR